MKKSVRSLFFVCMLLLLFSGEVFAVSIGISPGRVRFDNLLQDGYAERTVSITTNTDDILQGHFDVNGDMAEWVRFEPENSTFETSRSNPYRVKLIVEPPVDMPNGNYTGSIDFITDGVSSIDGRAGGVIKAAVTMLMAAEVSGDQTIDCRAGAFRFNDAEEGFPLAFGATIINDGNVRIRPTFLVEIWDTFQENLLMTREIVGDEVLPTTEVAILERTAHSLDLGQYWARILVQECNVENLLTFNVVEEGEIIDSGILSGIAAVPDAVVGENIEFKAKFENQGPRVVSAKFKGSVRLEDTIVKIIDTEEVLVDSGSVHDFSIFFAPQEEGRYVLNGRVLYNKKITFEKSQSLLVESIEEESDNTILPLIVYIIIIFTIIFILRKIMKERKRQRF